MKNGLIEARFRSDAVVLESMCQFLAAPDGRAPLEGAPLHDEPSSRFDANGEPLDVPWQGIHRHGPARDVAVGVVFRAPLSVLAVDDERYSPPAPVRERVQ